MKRQDKRRIKYLERKIKETNNLSFQEHEELLKLYKAESEQLLKISKLCQGVNTVLAIISVIVSIIFIATR